MRWPLLWGERETERERERESARGRERETERERERERERDGEASWRKDAEGCGMFISVWPAAGPRAQAIPEGYWKLYVLGGIMPVSVEKAS
jgi:hypothetical protein